MGIQNRITTYRALPPLPGVIGYQGWPRTILHNPLQRLSKNQPIDLAWSGVLKRLEVKPSIPPLPNPSPARGEGLLAVAYFVGPGLA